MHSRPSWLRIALWGTVLAACGVSAVACRRAPSSGAAATKAEGDPDGREGEVPMDKVVRTDEAWRALLSPEAYRVTRQAGTERAFTGRYWDTTTVGTYRCVACGLELFASDAKFVSGCGWPSFFEPLEGFHVTEHRDASHGKTRTEVRCRRCDAHLGHVFDDGPPPTGRRYCINSASLELVPDDGGR